MGLDMFLTKRTYVKNWSHQEESEKHQIEVKRGGEPHPHIKPERISYIIEEVAYWRKANQIHNWFVKNVQGGEDECQETYVEVGQLEELVSVCEEVIKDPSKGSDLLPTSSGFFFGSTEYGEYYIQDLKETVEMLKPLLKEAGGDFYYQSSW